MNDIASVERVCGAEKAEEPPSSKIFISYSHEDEGWLKYVRSHLRPAELAGELDLWDDRKLMGGADWQAEIAKALAECRVCILLVSRYSLTSDYIDRVEMKTALERAQSKGVCIYPIFVSSTFVPDDHWLRKFNWRPKDGQPLQDLFENTGERDKAMVAIVAEIVKLTRSPPAGEEKVESDKAAVDAIGQLAREVGKDPELRATLRAFKEILEKLNESIQVLFHYKELHDCLHDLQLRHYHQFFQCAHEIETSQQARDDFQEHIIEMTELCSRARDAAELLPERGADRGHVIRWVERLEVGIPKLKAAMREKRGELAREAFLPFRNVIVYEQKVINAGLIRLVEELQLKNLIDILKGVCDASSVDKSLKEGLQDGIHSLEEIEHKLDMSVIEHDGWQTIEPDFWEAEDLIENNDQNSIKEFKELYWCSIKSQVDHMAEDQIQAEWAKDAMEYRDEIDKILITDLVESKNFESLRSKFQLFRSTAQFHFHRVDKDLKNQCEHILKLRRPLQDLLHNLESSPAAAGYLA